MPIIVPEPAPVEPVEPGSTLIATVWDAMPEYVTDADDGTLHTYLDAAVWPTEPVVSQLTAGSGMVDPAAAPTGRLDWIAALAGVDLTSVPDGEKRAFIADPGSRFRGCRDAIVTRVGLTLTGSRTVQVECPHESDPLAILVRVFTPECADAAVTEAAARAEVPAWLALTFEVSDGIDYDALNTLFTDYDNMTATGGTYNALSNTQPPP